MQYYFEDFTENNYVRLLKLAHTKRQFVDYKGLYESDNAVVWRHDIDYSVHRASKLAQIEQREGVQTTYFVHFNSCFYNVFERDIIEKLKEIINAGHEIGVHFDCQMYDTLPDRERLERDLLFYKSILERLLDIEIQSFSFHNPTKELLATFNEKKYAGLYNAYSKEIMNEMAYCSDSNGYWRYKRLEDFLYMEKKSQMVVLTHPVWWTPRVMAPRERIQRAIDGRSQSTERKYDSALKKDGRNNIGK